MTSFKQAQRRATTFDLSVTLDTLPASVDFIDREVAPGHWLIVVRDGITYGELLRAYMEDLPAWARRRLFASVGVADPVADWKRYIRSVWWQNDWTLGPTAIRVAEAAVPGLITPWRHSWAA